MKTRCSLLFAQLLRSSLVNNRTQAKVAEELGMQEFAITNDKTKRPVALRTKTLADLLECRFPTFFTYSEPLRPPTEPFTCSSAAQGGSGKFCDRFPRSLCVRCETGSHVC